MLREVAVRSLHKAWSHCDSKLQNVPWCISTLPPGWARGSEREEEWRGEKGGRREKEELSRGLRGRKTGKPKEGGEPAKRGGDKRGREGVKWGHQRTYTSRVWKPQGHRVLVRGLIKYEGTLRVCWLNSYFSLYVLSFFSTLSLYNFLTPQDSLLSVAQFLSYSLLHFIAFFELLLSVFYICLLIFFYL